MATALLMGCCAQSSVHAARIGELGDYQFWEQAIRFFTFQDPAVRYALAGSILLGICCGLLGSFIVVRKMALVGDALSHAVLPGVACGFLWNMEKDPVAIFIGATAAGLLGTSVVHWITRTTRLKEDTALGMVLAGFFSVGICLVTMIQGQLQGNKSGLDKFLFGQAAAISPADVNLMTIVALVSVGTVWLFYKEFLATSFDSGFAEVSGIPAAWFHHALMLLLGFAVVIALQAVGVVLVSAMLITPAATAYLLTDRLHRMIWIAAGLGMGAGAFGAFFSFLGPNLPTGPFMVLAASGLFSLAFLFGPRHGLAVRYWKRRSRHKRITRENTLKAIYHVLENQNFERDGVTMDELARQRRETREEVLPKVENLREHGFITMNPTASQMFLTPSGWELACAIVRNHRLWELYLTNEANIAADHVHEDAEKIEHVLGDQVVQQLEKKLSLPSRDPHGRPIPGFREMRQGSPPPAPRERVSGYHPSR